jgi:hypothetical protein
MSSNNKSNPNNKAPDSTPSDISNQPGEHQPKQKLTRTAIKSFNEFTAETERLLADAGRLVQIYSKDLDPRVLSETKIEKLLLKFIKGSRASKIQLLIFDESFLRGVDHRLVALAQRFTSFLEIRVIPRDYHENHFGFYLTDKKRIIHRNNIERYEAEFAELPNSLVKEKSKWFDDIWQQSSPASFLRALHL